MTQAAKKAETNNNLPAVVDLHVTNETLSELSKQYSSLPAEMDNKDNYRFVQEGINTLRSLRSKVRDAGKVLKDDANAWIKKVTNEQKRVDDEICKILDPLAEHKKEYDDKVAEEKERKRKAEQARKDTHLANINGIRIMISKAQGQSSAEIEKVIEELEAIAIDDSFEEFKQEAQGVYDDTDIALRTMLLKAQTQEEEDYKRQQEAARLKREREELDKQRIENERIQKENERIAEENRKAAEAARQKEVEPAAETKAPVEQAKAANVSPAVQQRANEDNSVVAQARKNTIQAIEDVIGDHGNTIDLSNEILDAIIAGKIPNVKYDIY